MKLNYRILYISKQSIAELSDDNIVNTVLPTENDLLEGDVRVPFGTKEDKRLDFLSFTVIITQAMMGCLNLKCTKVLIYCIYTNVVVTQYYLKYLFLEEYFHIRLYK